MRSPARVAVFTRTRGDRTVLVAVDVGDRPVTARYASPPRPGENTHWSARTRVAPAATGSLAIPAHGDRVRVR